MTQQEKAEQWLSAELLTLRFSEADPNYRRNVADRIVAKLGDMLRPVVEADLRHSLISPHEADEQAVRRSHAAVADYCRNRRLALEAAHVHLSQPVHDVMMMLALDEAHYARLAGRTKSEQE